MKKIFLVMIILFLFGCYDNKMQEDSLKSEISSLLEKYRESINKNDQRLFSSIVSDKFSFYNDKKSDYIRKVFSVTFFIDDISYTNVRVKDYKIFTDVEITGSIIAKPTAEVPLFKDQLPFINGRINIRSVFALSYEKDGLKLLSEENILITKTFIWGESPPAIEKVSLSQYQLSPGDDLTVNFSGDRGFGNDAVFFMVNEHLIGGGSLANYQTLNNETLTMRIPTTLKKGENFDVKIMSFAGKVDFYNPQNADLKGIKIINYSVPVR